MAEQSAERFTRFSTKYCLKHTKKISKDVIHLGRTLLDLNNSLYINKGGARPFRTFRELLFIAASVSVSSQSPLK